MRLFRPALLISLLLPLASGVRAQGFDLWNASGEQAKPSPVSKPAPRKPAPPKVHHVRTEPAKRASQVIRPPQAIATVTPPAPPPAHTSPPVAAPAPAPKKTLPEQPAVSAPDAPPGLMLAGAILVLALAAGAWRLVARRSGQTKMPDVKAPDPAPTPAPIINLARDTADTPAEPAAPPVSPPSASATRGFQPSAMFATIAADAPQEALTELAPDLAPELAPEAAPPPPLVRFKPQRFSTSLTQASLRYALRLGNPADEAVGPLTITATLVSPESPALAAGEPEVHRLILIHAGGTADITGEVRLPLDAISPVMLADMRLFVPLLRVEVVAQRVGDRAALPPLTSTAEFLVGTTQESNGLGPFRLDNGPIAASNLKAHRQP